MTCCCANERNVCATTADLRRSTRACVVHNPVANLSSLATGLCDTGPCSSAMHESPSRTTVRTRPLRSARSRAPGARACSRTGPQVGAGTGLSCIVFWSGSAPGGRHARGLEARSPVPFPQGWPHARPIP